jgi:D-3-phosphoglycerate dehydrogenase
VIGTVGTILGDAEVNIDDMAVGSSPDGARALMVIATHTAVPEDVATRLREAAGITSVAVVDL